MGHNLLVGAALCPRQAAAAVDVLIFPPTVVPSEGLGVAAGGLQATQCPPGSWPVLGDGSSARDKTQVTVPHQPWKPLAWATLPAQLTGQDPRSVTGQGQICAPLAPRAGYHLGPKTLNHPGNRQLSFWSSIHSFIHPSFVHFIHTEGQLCARCPRRLPIYLSLRLWGRDSRSPS